MTHPQVSVIIINWNGAQYLHACLTSLCQQTYPLLEILVIDNASTDHSLHVIEEFESHLPEFTQQHQSRSLQIISNTQNKGFCYGNNQGIHQSQGEFVLLLNADVTLDARFIEILVDCMQSDGTIGITLGKLLNGHDPTKLDSTGIVIYKNRRAVDRGQGQDDIGQYELQEEVFGASGATCLYRRAMLDDIKYCRDDLHAIGRFQAYSPPLVGGVRGGGNEQPPHDEYLDEMFFAYKEDIDLAWRSQLAGWKCVYVPKAVGRHFRNWGSGKRTNIPKWIRRHSLKNRYLMLLKNEQWKTITPHLLVIFWYELQSLIYILLREPHLVLALKDIIRLWPEIRQKRDITQQHAARQSAALYIISWFQ